MSGVGMKYIVDIAAGWFKDGIGWEEAAAYLIGAYYAQWGLTEGGWYDRLAKEWKVQGSKGSTRTYQLGRKGNESNRT